MGTEFCIPIRVGEATVSSNHKAPLAAFVVVALACVVVLATNSMRSYARDAWRQFAAPVVSGLTLVPHSGGGSSPTPAAPDVAEHAADDAQAATNATPAVALTVAKAKPARHAHHHHRHHPAKTTPASDTTPAPADPQPATPQPPATPTWPSHSHTSWPTAVHQPTWPASTTPAANQGNHFGQNRQLTGLKHGPGNRGLPGMAPGRGVAKGLNKTAKTPFAAADKLPTSSSKGFGFPGHAASSFGSFGSRWR
jgi:hypothetical protein